MLREFDFGGSVKVFSYYDSRRQMKATGATNVDQEIKGPALENKVRRKQLAVDKSRSIMSGEVAV
jgi:hypothetical protein